MFKMSIIAATVEGVSLPRIASSEERVAQHKNTEKKIRKRSHGVVGSPSEPGSSETVGGSDTDTTPMLHAFHHLRSASNSSHSSQDGDSSDSSAEGGTENKERNNGNMHDRKEDGKAVAWTADDQKNILKIGCLEIERNQRLESLIARRRARYSDRNLIDFGSSDSSLPSIEELSKLNVQIPAVFAPRKNPFDLPYNEDNFPDSAPSALLQMGNPFDLPCEKEDVSSSAGEANSSHEEPISAASLLQSSALFRRHESFTKGAPFLSEFLQDARPYSRLRPYFVTEKMANEEMTSSSLEGETSEKGSSKASSVQDSDSTSSVTDEESQKDVLEDCSNQEQRPPFNAADEQAHVAQHVREVSLVLDMEPPLLISDSSDDDISLSGEHINDWVEAQHSENLNFPQDALLEDHSVMQQHQEIEMTRNGLHQVSPHSNDLELTSSSTESTDDSFEVDDIESPAKEVVVTDDSHIPDPVYDSSPSGSEKPASIGLVDHDEAREGSVSHADSPLSDISSKPTTESLNNGDISKEYIVELNVVFGVFQK